VAVSYNEETRCFIFSDKAKEAEVHKEVEIMSKYIKKKKRILEKLLEEKGKVSIVMKIEPMPDS